MNDEATNILGVPEPNQTGWNIAYSECTIKAPIEEVWDVLADLPGYDRWNSFTFAAEVGEFAPGAEFTFSVRMSRHFLRRQRERITRIEPLRILAWAFPYDRDLFLNATRYQVLTDRGGTSTLYRTWETLTGILVPILKIRLLADVRRGFEACAIDLKRHCESTEGIIP